MAINPLALTIRTKIIGVLIRDARQKANKTVDECGEAIGVSAQTFEEFEVGEKAISLPELEGITYYLGVPLEHFWGQEVISTGADRKPLSDMDQLIAIRQSMIGTLIRQARKECELSLETLAEMVKMDASQLEGYELGQEPIPLPLLELLTGVLNRSINEFQDRFGPIGIWNTQQESIQDFLKLSPEMQSFVSRPVNRLYLDLALRLSEMSVDKLRSVAEGLLEITY